MNAVAHSSSLVARRSSLVARRCGGGLALNEVGAMLGVERLLRHGVCRRFVLLESGRGDTGESSPYREEPVAPVVGVDAAWHGDVVSEHVADAAGKLLGSEATKRNRSGVCFLGR